MTALAVVCVVRPHKDPASPSVWGARVRDQIGSGKEAKDRDFRLGWLPSDRVIQCWLLLVVSLGNSFLAAYLSLRNTVSHQPSSWYVQVPLPSSVFQLCCSYKNRTPLAVDD